MIFLIFGSLLVIALLGGGSLLAALIYRSPCTTPGATVNHHTINVSILIPAHNEETKIETTLNALFNTISDFQVSPRIFIALDSCTDQTETKIEPWKQKLSIETLTVHHQSKWQTLQTLVQRAESDWIIFLDAGISFHPLFIQKLQVLMLDERLMAIAPPYQIKGASLVQRLFWFFEKSLKKMENHCGGPISLHGAAIAYRRQTLLRVFEKLNSFSKEDFSNDDIIIPLALRTYFPESIIYYLDDAFVFDQAKHEQTNFNTDLNRRIRMVNGNLQWIHWLYQKNNFRFMMGLISLRRILRPFWSEILLILITGVALTVGSIALLLSLPLFVFRGAALASLMAPILLLRNKFRYKSAWK